MERWDVVVVGAGASGLMAAQAAARTLKAQGQPGAVLLVEGNPKPGKKLLATGNGRCNLTNLEASLPHYHGDGTLAAPLLEEYTPQRILEEFEALGLLCRADSEGRVYPRSLQAAAVLQALRGACEEAGAILRCGWGVTGIRREEGGFRLENSQERPCGPPAACWPAEGRPLPSTPSPRGATGWPRAWVTGSPPCGPASPACKAPRSACAS